MSDTDAKKAPSAASKENEDDPEDQEEEEVEVEGKAEAEDHEYYNINNFREKIAPYLNNSDNKVLVRYFAFISNGDTNIDFDRTKYVPMAALERARTDPDFEFARSIALQYKPEMMAQANFVCCQCGKPAEDLLQFPMNVLNDEPPRIHDMAVQPVCDDRQCQIKSMNIHLNFYADMGSIVNRNIDEMTYTEGEQDVIQHIASADDPQRICLYCGRIGATSSLRRCSRCKKVWYCNKECQKKSWRSSHKKECRPPDAATTSDDAEQDK